MKKRALALLCLLSLALVLWLGRPAEAANYEGVYLVGVNDTLVLGLINQERMPVLRGGVIYAHYSVLDNRSLGVSYALNRTDGTFTIYTRRKTLVFATTGAGSNDKEGNEYPDRIINRNGKVYIPLRFVASFFDLTYSYYTLTLADGTVPIVRLCNEDAMLTDQQFGAQAAQLAAQPLRDYLAAQATPTPSPTPTPTPRPSPTPTPSAAPQLPVTAYLAVVCTDGTGFDRTLAALGRYDLSALFLFSPDDLVRRDGDVRKAAAAGHQIGLLLPGEDPQGAFEAGNALLGHILRGSATQVAFREEPADPAGNWQLWRSNVTLRGRTATAQAQNLLGDTAGLSTALVELEDSDGAARVLEAVLPTLVRSPYTLRVATETDPLM